MNLPYKYICDSKIRVFNDSFLNKEYFVLKAAVAVFNPGMIIVDGNGEQDTDQCIANILMLERQPKQLEKSLKTDCNTKKLTLVPSEQIQSMIGMLIEKTDNGYEVI